VEAGTFHFYLGKSTPECKVVGRPVFFPKFVAKTKLSIIRRILIIFLFPPLSWEVLFYDPIFPQTTKSVPVLVLWGNYTFFFPFPLFVCSGLAPDSDN